MTRNTKWTRRVPRLAVAVVAVTLIAASCGDDDDSTTTTAAPVTEAPTTDAPSTDAPAGGDVVEVVAVDYAFQNLPDSVPAGTRFTLRNDAPAEMHELVAFRLPDDEDRPLSELFTLPEEELGALFVGEPATVLLTPPGGEMIPAVGDGTLSEPGRYAIICAIPTGIDPADFLAAVEAAGGGPPEFEDAGPPHFVNGMFAELVVS